MSRAEWIEINGKRFSEAEIRQCRVVEYRCEVCGEFVAEETMVTIQNTQLYQWSTPPVYVPPMHFHPQHVPAELAPFLVEGR